MSRPPTPSSLRPSTPVHVQSTASNPAARRVSSGNLVHAPTDSSVAPGQRSKARDLLRKHYGLGIGPPPPTGKPEDPMDLDSPSFDAKQYYEQLITTSTLATLLKRENELLNEIRALHSDKQSLVYNHHHELIAASDTIGAMKVRAENLDAEMDSLKVAFSEISRLSSELANDRTD